MAINGLDDLFAEGLRRLYAAHHQGAKQTGRNHGYATSPSLRRTASSNTGCSRLNPTVDTFAMLLATTSSRRRSACWCPSSTKEETSMKTALSSKLATTGALGKDCRSSVL